MLEDGEVAKENVVPQNEPAAREGWKNQTVVQKQKKTGREGKIHTERAIGAQTLAGQR